MVRSVAHRVIISSIVLFFRRDWAGGAGPTVDAPRLVPVVVAVVVPGLVVVGADAVPVTAGADDAVVPVVPVVVVVDGAVVVVAGFPMFANMLLAGAAVVVAGVVESVEPFGFGVLKRPPDGAVVVAVGAAADDGVPRENREPWVLPPVVEVVVKDVDGFVVEADVREKAGCVEVPDDGVNNEPED